MAWTLPVRGRRGSAGAAHTSGEGDGDRADGGNGGHERGVVVARQLDEALVLHHRRDLRLLAGARDALVLVRLLKREAGGLRVLERQLLSRAIAAARAAAVLRVGAARDELLGREHGREA